MSTIELPYTLLGPSELPPIPEVGAWLARLAVIHGALDETRSLTTFNPGSSFMENYPFEYTLAHKYPGSSDWQDHPEYDHLQIHELSTMIPAPDGTGARTAIKKITKMAMVESVRPLSDFNEQMWRIQRHARRDALGRVGIITAELQVPNGVLAALMYLRGDIRDMGDRALYDQQRAIDRSTSDALASASEPDSTPIPDVAGTEPQQWWQRLEDELQSFDRMTSDNS